MFVLAATMVSSTPQLKGQAAGLTARLQVGAHVYFPDGRSVSTWRRFDKETTTGQKEIYTMDTLCVFNSDYQQIPRNVGYGWQFKVTPVRDVGETLIVKVDWNRSRDRGQTTETPKGSVELALAPGRSVPLDYIVPDSAQTAAYGPCNAVGMLLQVDLRR